MGLGKTIQVIALLLKLKEEKKLDKPSLVVCPTTLLGNWQKECEKFAPSLDVLIYHGLSRAIMPKFKFKFKDKDKDKASSIYNDIFKDKDIIITTYGTVRSDIDYLKELGWGLLIVDEAQNIKNPSTDQTRAVKSIKSDCRIAISGTPVENRLTELWSIFDFINEGYLLSLNEFQIYT
jgi:SNF2 family DNA or RNA helicase